MKEAELAHLIFPQIFTFSHHVVGDEFGKGVQGRLLLIRVAPAGQPRDRAQLHSQAAVLLTSAASWLPDCHPLPQLHLTLQGFSTWTWQLMTWSPPGICTSYMGTGSQVPRNGTFQASLGQHQEQHSLTPTVSYCSKQPQRFRHPNPRGRRNKCQPFVGKWQSHIH